MVQAGLLRHKLTIQESTSASDQSPATGEQIAVWTDYSTDVWCSAEPISGNEFFKENKRFSENAVRFSIRHSTAKPLNQGMRIVFNGNNYDITQVLNPDFRNRMSVITGELVT